MQCQGAAADRKDSWRENAEDVLFFFSMLLHLLAKSTPFLQTGCRWLVSRLTTASVKTLHKLWYKKKEEEEEAVVTCVWMLANKEKLLLSRNPRKQTLDVIASAKQAQTSLTEPLLSLFSVLSWFSS
jgi:hypothetical protein